MDSYEVMTSVVKAFRKRGKIQNLNIASVIENEREKYILLVCDTNDGIILDDNPYLVFKVKIPYDDFLSCEQPIDRQAGISADTLEEVILKRLVYRIWCKYKEAKKQLCK